ncbi:MAG: DUF92 domain-containing protein [Candidatus Methanomethylophilaceae archaeon]|nr:DUF92 domain-containing protein [Candidatus Methanomethylophilaceae archaeon]MBR7005866.1 DUF92 domain-containing protein [Candidatus Methanomethylophilaceae archaeon]
MDALTTAMLAAALSALMSYIAYKTGCLTRDGAAASFLVGAFTGIAGSVSAFVLLTIFTVSGFVATRIGFAKKKKAGLQEGNDGERNWKNVAGVGIPPCIIVALNALFPMEPLLFDVMFISTMTVAGADTIASEIGVKDPKAYLITTFKRVPPGTNGGVSLIGTAVSTIAALGIAIIGWLVMTGAADPLLLIPFVAGVVGNLLDSLFGTLLEDRGYISKYFNNGLTAVLGAVFGAGIYIAS